MLVEGLPLDVPNTEGEELPSTEMTAPKDDSVPENPSLDLDRSPTTQTQAESSHTLSLEDRVRRLEDVIASLHLAPQEWLEAARPPKPKPPEKTAVVADPRPAAPVPKMQVKPLPGFRGQPWLLVEIYAELRAMLRMFFDPRYTLSWQTRLMAPLMVIAIVMSRIMLSSIPLIGWILDFVIYPILLYFLFKVLSREATRYRMTSPDVPAGLRL